MTTRRNGTLITHLERMLTYHGWAYRRLLAAVEPLGEDAWKAPCGLFFGSLHGTLNHLAVADRIWLARVRGQPAPFARLDAEAAASRTELADYLAEGVQAWLQFLDQHDDVSLAAHLDYRNMRGEPFRKPLADIVLHLVNHGTHHRGQMSAALTAMGQPAPVLDYLYFLPDDL
ncbi:DinB family protein [Pseudomonas indica]|uniref:DinB family protein n=1 Tax=Pseudomonas indica TaxID=137658 RepID=UPI000BAB5116|nr:DinB family protein [Pseudomonas indica]PAU63730.1 damage-inducible protein DinB [Pseudomonas indica]